jgi:hypothetical protein
MPLSERRLPSPSIGTARAERVAALGFEGKWAIHPSQVPICNEVFAPTVSQVDWAHGVLAVMSDAIATGKDAIGRNGKVIDIAHCASRMKTQITHCYSSSQHVIVIRLLVAVPYATRDTVSRGCQRGVLFRQVVEE